MCTIGKALLAQEDQLNVYIYFFSHWFEGVVFLIFFFCYQLTLFSAVQDDNQVLKKTDNV